MPEDIGALRQEYAELFGKNPFNGWNADELRRRIDEELARDGGSEPFGGKGDHDGDGKPGGAAPSLIPVRVNRDFWDASGERFRKGSVVEVSVDAALDGVESGALSRVR